MLTSTDHKTINVNRIIYNINFIHSRNFQLAVARKTLGRTDDRNEMSLFEQRQAFSSLRAIKAGKKVGSIRTGHRVREHFPGTIPQISSAIHHTRPNSRIQIYQVYKYLIIYSKYNNINIH